MRRAPRVFRGVTDDGFFDPGKNSTMNGVCECDRVSVWMPD